MKNFLIPPDDCLILKAFNETQSLREAATYLQCDPAGLTRRVQSISSEYGLIQKVNNRWQLTSAGVDLVAWTDSCMQSQRRVLSGRSNVRIASTMWFAEEVLMPALPELQKSFDKDTSFSFTVPDNFENTLIEGSADFVIVCHPPENPDIEHKKIFDEDWIIVTPKSWRLKHSDFMHELKSRPFIRHSSINTDLFLEGMADGLCESGITLDNLIGIRSAVINGLGWSIVPKMLVQRHEKNQLLNTIDAHFNMSDRKVCIWWLRNRFDSRKISPKINHWLKSYRSTLDNI